MSNTLDIVRVNSPPIKGTAMAVSVTYPDFHSWIKRTYAGTTYLSLPRDVQEELTRHYAYQIDYPLGYLTFITDVEFITYADLTSLPDAAALLKTLTFTEIEDVLFDKRFNATVLAKRADGIWCVFDYFLPHYPPIEVGNPISITAWTYTSPFTITYDTYMDWAVAHTDSHNLFSLPGMVVNYLNSAFDGQSFTCDSSDSPGNLRDYLVNYELHNPFDTRDVRTAVLNERSDAVNALLADALYHATELWVER